MSEPLISVIVPVYNVEKYVGTCVDSILAQTYTKLEVLLVDDGSTDSSGVLCDEYARKDMRVRVIHKENGGLSDARNTGMKTAQGTYFAFVDSDDSIAEDYIAYLYGMIEKHHAQIAVCGYQKVYHSNENRKNIICDLTEKVYSTEEGLRQLLYQRGMITSAWGRLFDASLFLHTDAAGLPSSMKIQFPVGKLHEDVAVMYRLFGAADTIVCGGEVKYYYLQRADSIVNQQFDRRRMDYIAFTGECIQFMEDCYPNLRRAAVSRHFSACFELLSCIEDNNSYRIEYEQLANEIKKYRHIVLWDANARLKNRLAAAGSYISLRWLWKLSRLRNCYDDKHRSAR